MNPAGPPRGDNPSSEPFVPDLSEGAETGVYLALLELLDEGLIITGDEVIIDANSAACRLLEREYRQIAGRPLAELFPSERAFLDARARLFIQGEMRGSLRVALPGGRHRDFRFIAAARLRPGIHALILSRDWLAETTPEASSGFNAEVVLEAGGASRHDELWPRLAAALAQPVIVLDAVGLVAAANAAALTLLSMARTAVVGHPASEVFAIDWPADGAPPLAHLRPVGGGETQTARVLAGPHPGWRLLVLPPHVEAAKKGTAILEKARVADARVRLPVEVFDAASQAIFVSDAENRIVDVNRAFIDITGYSRKDVIGKDPAVLGASCHEPGFFRTMWQSLGETGQWQGEIWNRRKNGDVYSGWLAISAVRDAHGAARNYIGILSDLTARWRMESCADYVSHHDTLTGLPNRRLLEQRFAAVAEHVLLRHRGSVGILRIDVEGFKAFNREYGANTGDAVLCQIARRLLAALPRGAMIAREGCDSFLVLLPALEQESDASRIGAGLLAAMAPPFETGRGEACLGASIGAVLFPADGDAFDILLGRADAALLRARQPDGDGYQRYVADLDGPGILHRVFEANLRHAVEREQLAVYFQPLVDARSGRICAGEALLRWLHPELGLIPFRSFAAVARDSGLIVDLGDWALRTACLAAAGWTHGADGAAPMVTVNIAIEQVMRRDFVERVQQALADAALAPERLELDIDEQILTEDSAHAADTLAALAALGVHLAIDDFGRGLSAIPKLKLYPVRALKLDPALVREVGRSEQSEAIVEAIASLAGVLDLKIFARGVENAAQQAFLSALGCHLQQGPLFGKPMAQTEFAAFLAARGDSA